MKYFSQNKLSIIFCWIFIISSIKFGQNKKTPSCFTKEAHQFDFCVGEWNLHWTTPKGDTVYGFNNVKSILGGCVINENFSTKETQPFVGKSYSVYNSVKKIWEQTWVDNSGGYMVFTGGFKNDKMILSGKVSGKDGKEIIQRMVFYNILKDKLDWDWESSKDNGISW